MTDPLGHDVVGSTSTDDRALEQLAELRELLLRNERTDIAELKRRLDAMDLTPDEIAQHLPEAIALRAARDDNLSRALAPTVESALKRSVETNPRQITDAIFPILGPAIRKAIAEAFAGFVNNLNRTIEHGFSWRGLKWRWESIRTGVPYTQVVMKHALVYSVEHVFLIHTETGIVLAQAEAPDRETPNADVISGMLTAMKDFVQDSFDAEVEHGTREFLVGDFTVMAERGPTASLGVVVKGQPPPGLREKMQDTLATIHLAFAAPLADFDGDPGPFQDAEPILVTCLETVLSTDESEKLGLAPKLAWGLAGVLALLVIGLFIRSSIRWNNALALLDSEPGVVVVDADRGLGGWRLSGMRDPAGTPPLALLAGAGFDTSGVRAEWQPYVSLHPDIVMARLNASLDPPSSASLVVRGDTLVVSGSAPAEWEARAVPRALAVAGVSHVDVGALTVQPPSVLVTAARAVETRRVLFDIGRAELNGAARDSLSRLASDLVALRAAADEMGYNWSVEIVGRSDTTGLSETNRLLSRYRAEVVRSRLAAMGAVAADANIRGVGASDPLQAVDPADGRQVNRSVVVRVTLTRRATGGAVR